MKREEDLGPEARELLEQIRSKGNGGSPLDTPDNENMVILGGGLSLGLIEHKGLNKPALIMSIQYATLLSAESMEAIAATLAEMGKGIIVAKSGDLPPKMGMIKGGM